MKKVFICFIVSVVFIFTSCAEIITVIDVKGSDLENLNAEGTKDTILIIDTRPYTEYKNGHLPNAINIPKSEINTRVNEFEDWKEKPIYVYADTDDDSFEAAKIFVEAGCKIIYNAEGIKQYSYKTIKYDCMRGVVFEQKINSPNIIIIDCRTKQAYDMGHILGAISIPSIPIAEFEKNIANLPKDKKLFLYCNVGSASARAALTLSEAGFKEIYNTIDGVREYPFNLIQEETPRDKRQ
ncbi:rhodanese-like domain-containing protein [Treponema pedis]|uniref:rhodanese-like domain-containing protein n=1 Tax=Treponema pedis TaxID=409322 RepID=UPI003133E566